MDIDWTISSICVFWETIIMEGAEQFIRAGEAFTLTSLKFYPFGFDPLFFR